MATFGKYALVAAITIAVASGQVVKPPSNVSASADDNSIVVTWLHSGDGRAASYTVIARPIDLPVIPSSFTTKFSDEFDGSVLDSLQFAFTSDLCDTKNGICTTYPASCSNWGSCGTTYPSAAVSGGSARITAPPYQYMVPAGYSITYVNPNNKYGRNGVGFIERKTTGDIGSNTVFFTQVETDGVGVSSYPYYYYQAGFVVYDKDANSNPRPFLMYYYRYATTVSGYTYINSVYYRYLTSSGWTSDNRLQFDGRYTQQAMELYLVRNNDAKTFEFVYRRSDLDSFPVYGSTGCFSGCSRAIVYDSWINGVSWNPNNTFVSLYAENYYPTTARTVAFSWYKTMDHSWFTNTYMKAVADTRTRNTTIATSGICATSRQMVRTVPFPLTRAVITGVYNGEGYYVSIYAADAATVPTLSSTVSLPSVFTPRPTPMTFTPISGFTPTVGLMLDGMSSRPTGNGNFDFWRDVSGNNHHFSKKFASSSQMPKVPFPTSSNRKIGVYFSNTNSELVQDDANDDFLSLPAADVTNCYPSGGSTICPGFDQHDTNWFILYQPTYNYASQNLMSRGSGYGGQTTGTGSSWEIASMYYGWPDSYLGIRIYGNGAVGGTIGQKMPSDYTHPHAANPTLLSYSYNFQSVSNNLANFALHACEGLQKSDNTDRCSYKLSGGNPSIKNPWSATFQFNQYGPNFASLQGDTPTTFDSVRWGVFPKTGGLARISDARYLSGWANYYYGYIYSIAVFRGSNAITEPTHRKEAQQYMLERYFMLCPSINPPSAVSPCDPGAEGSVCSIQCAPPAVRIGGPGLTSPMTCMSGAWVGRGTQCGGYCKVINQPSNVKTCKRVFHSDNFDTQTVGSNFYNDFRYDSAPLLPARLFKQYFTVASGGYLQVVVPGRDDSCSILDPVVFSLNSPEWSDVTKTVPDYVDVEATVLLSSINARAGVAARVFQSGGKSSYYAMSIAHGTKGASLTKVLNDNAPVPAGSTTIPNFVAPLNTWITMKITVAKSSIKGYINGTLAFDTADSDITVGSGGLYVENGMVLFDNFAVSGACDSSGNCQVTSGGQCQYACADGYTVVGNQTQTCDSSGQYMGTPLTCVPTPPDIKPATFSVPEDAVQGYVIGKMNATSLGAGREVIIFKTIDQTSPFYSNVETLYTASANPVVTGTIAGVFGINLCSGELYVAKAGIIDYRAFEPVAFGQGSQITPYQRKVIVRAIVGNKADVYTDVIITINVLRSVKPPVFLDPVDSSPTLRMFRGVFENYVGPFTGADGDAVAATPLEPNPILYDIIFGNSAGFFGINNLTGQLSVAKTGLNFESDSKRYEIMVRARDSVYPDKSAVVLVEVSVKDAEDAPYADNPQKFKVSESRAFNNLLLGSVTASDEDIGDLISFSIDVTAAGDRLNYLQSTFHLNATNGELTLKRTLTYDPELSDVLVADGLQVREFFQLPCLVTDRYGPKSTSFNVNIYILANLTTGPEPMFSSIRYPGEGVSTKGEQIVQIGGQNFDTIINNNNNVTDVWVNFTTQENDPTTYGAYCQPSCPVSCDPLDAVCVPCSSLKCPRTYQLTNCSIVDATVIRCTTVPGFGNRLVVQVRHGKLRKRMLSPEAAVFVDFAKPTITAVRGALEPGRVPDNPNALPTNGGSSLILRVTEFGPQDRTVGYYNARLQVLYGVDFEYSATVMYERDRFNNLLYPDVAGDDIKIHTIEGIGANLPIKIIAGLQVSYVTAVTLSFAPPSISSVSVPALSSYTIGKLSTVGGETFYIDGANFGPLSMLPQDLRYTSIQSVPIDGVSQSVTFSFTPVCFKSDALTAHSRLTCTTAAGVGKQHPITLTVGNQTTTSVSPFLLTYLPPIVTSMDGEGIFLADTQGGQKVNLKGNNLGPIAMGDTTPNAARVAPLSITYGPSGIEYIAQGCVVSSTDATVISCLTAPGTGKGHIWNLYVAGQGAPTYLANTSYAPPVITAFSRTDLNPDTYLPLLSSSYRTNGAEVVIIDGKNFGPSLVSNKFSAVYTLSLRENKTEYDTFVGGDVNAQITFPASACTMTVPHFQLSCLTTAGAGTDLSWTLIVDSQPSTQPVIAYGAPVINTVRDMSNNPVGGPASIDGVSTDGGDTLILRGKNFGPRTDVNCKTSGGWLAQHATNPVCHGYVQQVRYGRTGTEYSVADFDVANEATHDIMYVKIAPGFGKGLRFRVIIAGQASELSSEAFDYRSPRVTMITPDMADTDASSTNVIKVKVEGYDFSLLDPLASVGIVFGNEGDGTLRPSVLSVVDRYPDWQDADSRSSFVAGSKQFVTFLLPPGVMDMRATRVAVFLNGQANGYKVMSDPLQDAVVTDPLDPPTAYFSYNPPVINTVSVAVVNRSDTEFVRWMLFSVPGISNQDIPNYFVVTLRGSNFGPNASVTNDRVIRGVQYKPYEDQGVANWADNQYTWYSWNHNAIVAVTKQSKAKIRVYFAGSAFDRTPQVYGSDAYQYADVSPTVGNLVGNKGPFATNGGDIIAFTVSNLKSARTVQVTVGGRRCEICRKSGDPNGLEGEIITDIINQVILNPSPVYYSPSLADPNCLWTLYCLLPAGEGKNQPVIVQRDDVFSDSGGGTVDYMSPTISKIIAYNAFGQKQQEFTPDALNANGMTIFVDTEPTVVEIEGTNFGLCPQVVAGSAGPRQLGLRRDRCGTWSVPSNYTRSGTGLFNDHEYIRFRSAPGEGTGLLMDPNYGFRLTVNVNGQSHDSQIVKFRYTPPVIATVTPSGRTEGGDLITITGTNFGSTMPVVDIGLLGSGNLGMLPCTNVTFNRVSTPGVVSCTLAEGSGALLNVRLYAGDQNFIAATNFSYLSPMVRTILVTEEGKPVQTINLGNGVNRVRPRGSSTGGYNLTLVGDNFGSFDYGNHCLFVAWRGERLELPVVCNGIYDFVGENEIPSFAIVSWNHTAITFTMPPGAGVREIMPFIRGQKPTPFQRDGIIWYYNTPSISGELDPNHGSTDGKSLITINGNDFGFAPINTLDGSLRAHQTDFPARLEDYLNKPVAPQQIMTVGFFRSCISGHFDETGQIPAKTATCLSDIVTHKHSSVQFRTPSYIGVNRSVAVTIHDHVFNFVTNKPEYINFTSNEVYFNYDPPKITQTFASKIRMNGVKTNNLQMIGVNMGTASAWGASCDWTQQERFISYTVAGLPCDAKLRLAGCPGDVSSVRAGPTPRGDDLRFECDFAPTTVGHKNLSYTMVGQSNFNPDTDPIGGVFAVCEANYFGRPGETCLTCPDGAYCAGFDARITDPKDNQTLIDRGVHTYPRPDFGFFNLNSTDSKTQGMYGSCPEMIANQYPGRDVCIVACSPPESCLGDNYCEYGYRSIAPYYRCATCDIGFYRRANECVKCPDSPWALVIGFCCLVMIGGAAAYVLNKMKINLAFVSIGIDYFQVLAIFAQSKVQWPPEIKELFHILSAFNLNIEIVAPECIVPNLAYKQKWSFIMALPIAIVTFFGLMTMGMGVYKALIKGQKVKLMNQFAALAASVFLLMYILYIYLTRNVLDIFNCAPTDPPDGKTYLAAVFEECGLRDGTQMTLMPAAVIALIVYVLGYPLFVGFLLYNNKETVMEDQLLRAKGVGDDKLSNPRGYRFRKQYSRIYYQFRPETFMWIEAILARKFFLSISYILFNRNPSFQLAAALLIMVLSFSAQVRYNPYMSPADCEGVIKQHELFAIQGDKLRMKLQERLRSVETRGRKRVHRNIMTGEGKIDARALLGLLRGWLFNYNTVEAVMLFSAVIVALMGIMYSSQARASAYYGEAREAVTGVVLFVVIVSIIYYVTVVAVEITTLTGEANRKKVMAKRAIAKRKGDETDDTRRKDKEARVNSMSPSDVLSGPIESMNNPLFTDGGAGMMSNASVQETIMSVTTTPSMDLWRMFQSAFVNMQSEVENVSKKLAEAKAQSQRLEQAQAMLAEAGISVDLSHNKHPNLRKSKAEFGPTSTGDSAGNSPAMSPMSRSPGVSTPRSRVLGSFANKSIGAAGGAGAGKVALKSLRKGGSGGGGVGGGGSGGGGGGAAEEE